MNGITISDIEPPPGYRRAARVCSEDGAAHLGDVLERRIRTEVVGSEGRWSPERSSWHARLPDGRVGARGYSRMAGAIHALCGAFAFPETWR